MQKSEPAEESSSFVGRAIRVWQSYPLYLRILAGVIAGLIVGLLLAQVAGDELTKPTDKQSVHSHAAGLLYGLEVPANLVLRILGALAPPLILLAVIQALMHAKFPPGTIGRLVSLLLINTLAAILIGLFVANTLQPGKWKFGAKQPAENQAAQADAPEQPAGEKTAEKNEEKPKEEKKEVGPKFSMEQILENIPRSILGPLSDNGKAISVIILAVALGLALRPNKNVPITKVADVVDVMFTVLITMLHWVIEIIPFAVFCKVANLVGVKGFAPFVSLGGFVVAVLIALSLQMIYYLVRIKFFSWCNPFTVVMGMRDALVMAFSTGSSTATMPVTYTCLREKVGLREQSASLGSLVGANFNNDGTALYEAMSALFIAQLIGVELDYWHQFLVIVTSVIASVGAAGIPEAGLVTMTLVFTAVGLDIKHIPMLLAVDWFLDRCRTALNVMGDVNVSCLLDGYEREVPGEVAPAAASPPEIAAAPEPTASTVEIVSTPNAPANGPDDTAQK
ncbi:dicarboxylate/amino acid:cation symporter [Anatilimnocola sp. NA78]|uniref:dicarboxylate/amino acid:cation symporter n=1 Tax=Anatilimnocola sp. NA78 TaxID=3415683 RepID=UPI003CE48B03